MRLGTGLIPVPIFYILVYMPEELEHLPDSIVAVQEKSAFFYRLPPIVWQFGRFFALGFLNTAVDFILLNALSKLFLVDQGSGLAAINVVSFIIAVVHSFIWNRMWVFGVGDNQKKWTELVTLGSLGLGALLVTWAGAAFEWQAGWYFLVFILLLAAEGVFWWRFRLVWPEFGAAGDRSQMITFVLVSVIGVLLNTTLVTILTPRLLEQTFINLGPDLPKNIAKAAATGLSLVWNFVGYKFLVFKK